MSMEHKVAAGTLKVLEQAEKQIDANLEKLENLTDDDYAQLRVKRIQELKEQAKKEAEWRERGHGKYVEVSDQQEWFSEVKNNERVVCHFYRASTWRCEIVDKHLQLLAAKHLETKFIRINAEKSPFLAQRLNIVLLPTIVCTKDNYTAGQLEGFDELGGTDKFTTNELARALAKRSGIMLKDDEIYDQPVPNKPLTYNTVTSNRDGKAIYGGVKGKVDDAEEEDDDDWLKD